MKKMLVLALVLAVAGFANAAVVDLYVNNALAGTTLDASGPVNLALARTTTTGFLGGFYYKLVCETASGSFAGGVPVIYTTANQADGQIQVSYAVSTAAAYDPALAAGLGGMGYAYFNFDEYNEGEGEASEAVPAGIVIKDIMFTGIAGKTAHVDIYTTTEIGAGSVWSLRDSLAITTLVPEPMTMGLLALGALFLRKK